MLLPRSCMRPIYIPDSNNEKPTSPISISRRRRPVITPTQPKHIRPTVQPTNVLRSRTAPAKLTPTSQPMSIPVKKQASASSRSELKKGRVNEKLPPLPASVAAILANTTIPPRRPKPRTSASLPRRVSIEHLRKEWQKDVSASSSLGRGSPLDFLLETSDGLAITEDEHDNDRDVGSLPSRSVSSDSIMSTPSLELDEILMSPSFSLPMTPNSLRRPSRIDRKFSSPPAEECYDHPLLDILPEDIEAYTPTSSTVKLPRKRSSKPRSSLKSNLTASFQALRSAAKAFSNFTAPSVPSDDFLTRSLFNTKYAPEMRPKTFDGLPDPALRRYMNPLHDFHRMLTDARWTGEDTPSPKSLETTLAPMIQMQTYTRGRSNGSKRRLASSKRPSEDPVDSSELAILPRQREPRENSDFLRVIVLEMNMRRSGKLDMKAAGHARVWLPPRKTVATMSYTVDINGGSVPERWAGVSVGDF